MRAITVTPGVANSARLGDVPPPPPSDGAILVRTLALGVCGTDREIVAGEYGDAPPGERNLVLGHESLGRVEEAPAQSGFAPGDLVVGIVRRPDPVPCPACAAGEWDMCRNGRYVERGGMAEIAELEPDIVMECTGAPAVIRDVLVRTAPDGIICLASVTAPGHAFEFDIGGYNRTMVLNNGAVFGTVNANHAHYDMAADALARADRAWLEQLITRRVPLERWAEALEHRPGDIKVIIEFAA